MKKNILALSLILVFFLALSIFSQTQVLPQSQESISVTTYYPAPYGVYKQMEAESLGVGDTNNDGTINGADVPADPGDCWVAGDVGIGTRSPAAKLDVTGGIKIGDDGRSCSGTIAGTVRYRSSNLEYCDGATWKVAFEPSFVIHDAPAFHEGGWRDLVNIGLNRKCIPFPKDGWNGVEEVSCAYDPATGWIRGLTDDDAICSYACFDE